MNDLGRLERELAEYDRRLPDDGTVRLALACAEIDDGAEGGDREARLQLRELIGRTLASSDEQPIARFRVVAAESNALPGGS